MSNLVPASEIERIVGASRHQTRHYGRVVSTEEIVYVLHSHECKDSGIDLRECDFSLALDEGIDMEIWDRFQDMSVDLAILTTGKLAPLAVVR